MNAEIMRKLNQQNTLDNMLPLTAFSDAAKAEELGKQGYNPGYTLEGWRDAFPDIDPEHVLFPKMVLFPPSLIYYDPEHYICFDTHIYGGAMPIQQGAGGQIDFGRMLRERIADGMKDYKERNYASLLFPMTSEECGGIAIRILREMLEREEPSPRCTRLSSPSIRSVTVGRICLGRRRWGGWSCARAKSKRPKQSGS